MHLHELAARESIRDAIARYAHAADTGRFEDLAALFAADGVLAIDTGCVWGGTLAAQRIDAPSRPVFVPSRRPPVDFSSE